MISIRSHGSIRPKIRLPLSKSEPFSRNSDRHRETVNDHDPDDHKFEVSFDLRDIAKIVAGEQKGSDPQEGPGNVKDRETTIRHDPDPSDKRGKGPDDWHESGENDGLSSMPLVKRLGCQEVFLVEPPTPLAREYSWADTATDRIIDRVTKNRGGEESQQQPWDLKGRPIDGCQGPQGEEERITGQEGSNDQACLTKDDQKEGEVDPRPQDGQPLIEMEIEVKKDIKESPAIHKWSPLPLTNIKSGVKVKL
jgi:hypothetical protein